MLEGHGIDANGSRLVFVFKVVVADFAVGATVELLVGDPYPHGGIDVNGGVVHHGGDNDSLKSRSRAIEVGAGDIAVGNFS